MGHLPAEVWGLLPFSKRHHKSPLAQGRRRHFLAQGAADQLQEEGEEFWVQVNDVSPCWDDFIHSAGHLREKKDRPVKQILLLRGCHRSASFVSGVVVIFKHTPDKNTQKRNIINRLGFLGLLYWCYGFRWTHHGKDMFSSMGGFSFKNFSFKSYFFHFNTNHSSPSLPSIPSIFPSTQTLIYSSERVRPSMGSQQSLA